MKGGYSPQEKTDGTPFYVVLVGRVSKPPPPEQQTTQVPEIAPAIVIKPPGEEPTNNTSV